MAVAEHLETGADDVEPELYDYIDPEVLDRLTGSPGVVIEFQYHGRQARVRDGIQVESGPRNCAAVTAESGVDGFGDVDVPDPDADVAVGSLGDRFGDEVRESRVVFPGRNSEDDDHPVGRVGHVRPVFDDLHAPDGDFVVLRLVERRPNFVLDAGLQL